MYWIIVFRVTGHIRIKEIKWAAKLIIFLHGNKIYVSITIRFLIAYTTRNETRRPLSACYKPLGFASRVMAHREGTSTFVISSVIYYFRQIPNRNLNMSLLLQIFALQRAKRIRENKKSIFCKTIKIITYISGDVVNQVHFYL